MTPAPRRPLRPGAAALRAAAAGLPSADPIQAALAVALDRAPQLASVLCRAPLVPRPGLGTFCVDAGGRIYVDPARVHVPARTHGAPPAPCPAGQWTVSQAASVLVHEAWHWVCEHHGRSARFYAERPDLPPAALARMLNDAQDAEINGRLRAEGYDLPAGVFPEDVGQPRDWAGLFEEAVRLPPPAPQQPQKGPPQPQDGAEGEDGDQDGQDGAEGEDGDQDGQDGAEGEDGDQDGQGTGSGAGSRRDPGGIQSGSSRDPSGIHPGTGGGSDPGTSRPRGAGSRDGAGLPGADLSASELGGSGAHGLRRPWELPADGDPEAEGPAREATRALTREEADAIRDAVAAAVVEAAKSRGTDPGGWGVWASGRLAPPEVDWRRELRAQVSTATVLARGCDDYSYTRPSRRGTFCGVIMPRLVRPQPEVVVVVDTSGSMGAADLTAAVSEIEGVIRALGQRDVPVISCDAAAHAYQRVRAARDVRLQGGGGTDMRVGIQAAIDDLHARVVVVLTDGYTPWPETRPRGVHVVAGMVGHERTALPEHPDWLCAVAIPRRQLHGGGATH
jgi:hypothetical protein